MIDLSECDKFTDHRRKICRGECPGLSDEMVDKYRRHWGMAPLYGRPIARQPQKAIRPINSKPPNRLAQKLIAVVDDTPHTLRWNAPHRVWLGTIRGALAQLELVNSKWLLTYGETQTELPAKDFDLIDLQFNVQVDCSTTSIVSITE